MKIQCYLASMPPFTMSRKVLAGLKAGTEWAGMMTVVLLEMLRPVFCALRLIIKLPNPHRKTSSPAIIEFFTLFINASTTAVTVFFSIPVCFAIRSTISAFVMV